MGVVASFPHGLLPLALDFSGSVAKPFLFGLANGAGFGLVAVGLVLIYKSSRVFNFAAGEFATLGAFGLYLGVHGFHLPYPLAMVLGVLTGTVAGLVSERLVVRPLADRPKVTILVATAAVAILLIPLELILGGTKTFQVLPAFRSGVTVAGTKILGPIGITLFDTGISPQQLLVALVLGIFGVVLAWFFARTDLGLATLASSQEPTATRLMGIRLNRISMLTWGTAGFLGGLAGVLLPAITESFAAGYGTTNVLIPAFAAAVLGGMTSVPGAFLGGIGVGLIQAFAQFDLTKIPGTTTDLPGSDSLALLVVLIAVLLIRPAGLLGKEA